MCKKFKKFEKMNINNCGCVRINGGGNIRQSEGAQNENNQLIEPPLSSRRPTISTITREVRLEEEWTQMPQVRLFRIHRKRILCIGIAAVCIFTYLQFLSYEAVSMHNTTPEQHQQKKKSCAFQLMPDYEPIDVVYTWVNGSEKRFQEDVEFYSDLYDRDEIPEESYAPERFNDKDELKYSLRSLEKHMPWIRHVYIVTNGQIPSWLNLDYEKVTIVTHEEIFADKEYLPTFSSPAIEANLHRIPGLSQKFIYFNDDIFLNSDAFPEDFYTQSKGYQVYVAWNIHNCANNCDWHKLNDSKCDKVCNNKNCDWDYNDCNGFVDTQSNLKDSSNDSSSQLSPSPKPKPSELPKFLIGKQQTSTPTIRHYFNFIANLSSNSPTNDLKEKIKLYNDQKMQESKRERSLTRSIQGNAFSSDNRQEQQPKAKDLYSGSLIFTQKQVSKRFGFKSRAVIAHAPIMIDREIMRNAEIEFAQEFHETMKQKFRQQDILQMSFLYAHYLSSKTFEKTMEEIFDEYDTDQSGTWSDREIHTLLTRVSNLPLTFETVTEFQNLLTNCSNLLSEEEMLWEINQHPVRLNYERYVDSTLNLITKKMIVNCPSLKTKIKNFPEVSKSKAYKYEFVDSYNDVSFNMLVSQPVIVMDLLNNIRKSNKKFVCINDDLDRSKAVNADNDFLITLLQDFFLSLYPKPSKFELPVAYRNRFARVEDLQHWRIWRWSDASRKSLTAVLVVITIMCVVLFIWQLPLQRYLGYRNFQAANHRVLHGGTRRWNINS